VSLPVSCAELEEKGKLYKALQTYIENVKHSYVSSFLSCASFFMNADVCEYLSKYWMQINNSRYKRYAWHAVSRKEDVNRII